MSMTKHSREWDRRKSDPIPCFCVLCIMPRVGILPQGMGFSAWAAAMASAKAMASAISSGSV